MAASAVLVVNSLADAIEAFMESPTATRLVVVSSIQVGHSAALLAFLDSQVRDGLCEIQNGARLHDLASIDCLFGAIALDVLPVLVVNPTSPTLPLLSRYAAHIQAWAPAVGGLFEDRATTLCKDLVAYANNRRHPRLSAADLPRRLNIFRSESFTIAENNPVNYDDNALLARMEGLGQIHANSFRRLATLREEVINIDSPPAERRVVIDALPASHASALLGVVHFEGIASDWIVHNLLRLTTLANVDVSFELIGLGILPFLHDNPTSQPAVEFLFNYVRRIREDAEAVGGEFAERAIILCDDLIAHGTVLLPPPKMRIATEKLRKKLNVFRFRRVLFMYYSDSTDDEDETSSDSHESAGSSDMSLD